MATVTEIVKGALLLLEIKVAEAAITGAEAEDGRVALNDMMNEWNVNGINVGYETLDNADDELFVDLGAIGAIKANLAVYIAPEYGRSVGEELRLRARRSKRSLRGSIDLKPTEFPDSLPIGSGNEDNHFVADGDRPGNLRNHRFFPSNVRRKCN